MNIDLKKISCKAALGLLMGASVFLMSGCVDQHPEGTETATTEPVDTDNVKSLLEITDPVEKAAVEAARAKVRRFTQLLFWLLCQR